MIDVPNAAVAATFRQVLRDFGGTSETLLDVPGGRIVIFQGQTDLWWSWQAIFAYVGVGFYDLPGLSAAPAPGPRRIALEALLALFRNTLASIEGELDRLRIEERTRTEIEAACAKEAEQRRVAPDNRTKYEQLMDMPPPINPHPEE